MLIIEEDYKCWKIGNSKTIELLLGIPRWTFSQALAVATQ